MKAVPKLHRPEAFLFFNIVIIPEKVVVHFFIVVLCFGIIFGYCHVDIVGSVVVVRFWVARVCVPI